MFSTHHPDRRPSSCQTNTSTNDKHFLKSRPCLRATLHFWGQRYRGVVRSRREATSCAAETDHAEVSGGHTERAVLRLVGRSNHWQASADPAAAGETCRRVGLGHGIQGLQGGQREVVDLVSDAGLGAGAVFRASALGVEEDKLLWDDTLVRLEENTAHPSFNHMLLCLTALNI